MRYTAGVVLDGEDLRRLARLVQDGVLWRQRVNGGARAEDLQLRDQLARFAAESALIQVGADPERTKAVAAVTVAEFSPAEMTASAAAGLIGVSAQAVCGWCRTGQLLATRSPAGTWRIDADSAASLAARRKGA